MLGDCYAEQLVDEQILTLAPQIAGRNAGDRRLSLVMGRVFVPGDPLGRDHDRHAVPGRPRVLALLVSQTSA